SDPKFATIKALVVRPESAADAYLAMVEENEIRVNLSHYERARIAVQALAEGVYPDQRKALLGLFQNVPRAKRSKIASFVTLVEALEDVLRYPTAIPEKLGLGLARAFAQTPQFAQEVAQKLRERPCVDAEGEQALLSDLLAAHEQSGIADITETPPAPAGSDSEETPQTPPTSDSPTLMPQVRSLDPVEQNEDSERGSMPVSTGVHLDYSPSHQRIKLTGPGVDTALLTALKDWLRQR
ncbi:MAG: chromosome partitioning protein ParB, partial [Epibacterium sp.]|nr:chromosome partitioning protein ParB [Epibacterium sp.]NQX75922.1 chromosome partitioning protein ParB [Epibacterium sp.]